MKILPNLNNGILVGSFVDLGVSNTIGSGVGLGVRSDVG